MTRTYPSKCDTICPDCGERNTIYRPYEPPGKWTGLWYCDGCGWRGYPKDFEHVF